MSVNRISSHKYLQINQYSSFNKSLLTSNNQTSDVNKDWTHKDQDKDKDQSHKDKDKDKDLTYKDSKQKRRQAHHSFLKLCHNMPSKNTEIQNNIVTF